MIGFFRPQRVMWVGLPVAGVCYVPPFLTGLPEHGGIDWPIDFQISSHGRK